MAKKNWYIEANKSEDPEVKDLLAQYNKLDANSADYAEQKESLVAAIKAKLDLEAPDVPESAPESDTDSVGETPDNSDDTNKDEETGDSDESSDGDQDDKPSEPEKTEEEPVKTFSYTEKDAAKATSIEYLIELKKACREEIARLERTRLKHATYKENRILDTKIWNVRRIIGIALKRELALKERARRIRNAGRVSSLALKRARFVKLMRQGISITNITKHPEGVKKEELEQVLDVETIEACKKNNSRFPEMWQRWKTKFLDNQEEKKQ